MQDCCKSRIDCTKSMKLAYRKAHCYLDATVSIGPSPCSVTDGPHFLSNYGRYLSSRVYWEINTILTHLAYIVSGKTSCSNLQQFTGRKCVTLFSAILWCHSSHRPCLLDVRWCNVVFVRYKGKKYMEMLALQSKLWLDFFSAMAET